jgi:hypothetical protein
MKRTFAKHFFRHIVKFALELVEELVDCRGELALGIGVLELVSRGSVLRVGMRGKYTGCERKDSSAVVFSGEASSAMVYS